jgi:pimeloyl-ACP methyl ester carboxylesterase
VTSVPVSTHATTTTFVDGQPIEYRYAPGTGPTVLILPGAHMSAANAFGERRLLPADAGVLVVSRPGYGRTPVAAGPSAPEFAHRLAGLVRRLGLSRVSALGVSMGARTALTLAAQQPQLVSSVVLLCPVSFARWPDPRRRRAAWVLFNPVAQSSTWRLLRTLLINRPDVILPSAVRDLTTLAPAEALRRMGGDLDELVRFLAGCGSGRGFATDLRPPTDVAADVSQPVLLLATRSDGSVDFGHAERLAGQLPAARLVDVDAATHLLWLGDRAGTVSRTVRGFLG